jgi:Aerotolerance regulator N-terminal
MIFLNPSILLGLFAASIPILIHILNFRKLQKVEFSTLSFLKELQKSKIKKIKIKQWLLLLLRTLIIIFLVLAFARPTLENVSLAGTTSTAKSSTVFILDNSFSMSYVGDNGSNFNRSKKTVKSIIEQIENGDEFIFPISIDSVLSTSNKEIAIKAIDDLNINFLSESTIEKLNIAISHLRKSQNINKEIFLFSDLQSSTFDIKNNTDSLKIEFAKNGIKFYLFDMSLENTGNYSVSNLNLENSIIELNKSLTFTVSTHNFSDNSVINLTASLFLNDKRVAQQSVNLKERKEKIIRFETSLSASGLNEARVELEDDDILYDNICYLNFFVPKNINVLILYDQISDILFVEAALKSSSTAEQIKITKINISEATNYNPKDFNIVFLVSSKVNQIDDISKYLKQGGKLLYIPSSSINQNELAVLSDFINLPSSETIISTKPSNNNYSELGKIDRQHPIFLNLFEARANKQIESPYIFKYIKFNESNSAYPIIRLIDDSIFLGEYKIGDGTVLFFNSSAVLSWSNFPIKGIFAPIISRIVHYLSSTNDGLVSYTVGEPIPIDVSQVTYPLIDVSLPKGNAKINLQTNNKQVVNFINSDVPGSYKFYNNNQLLSFTSVNPNSKESDLTKIDENLMFDSFNKLFGDHYIVFNPNENYFAKIKQARFGTELWKYLLIITLLLALCEMYIARSTKKDLITLN